MSYVPGMRDQRSTNDRFVEATTGTYRTQNTLPPTDQSKGLTGPQQSVSQSTESINLLG